MGFSEAVRWWEEWQLPILISTSLFLQFFLFFAGTLRKRSIPSWLRFLIWLTYVSSDAVAIYALAALFSWQKTQDKKVLARLPVLWARLQVLWAPILLIHLGGQDGITAYNIEDNELWRRHVITAVYQVAVAVYVFVKWWPQDKKVLAIGVLLFAVGILKCVLKPWYLKRASINSLVDSSRSEQVRSLSSFEEQYVQDATRYFQEGHGYPLPSPEDDEVWKPYDLFVDLTPHHLIRLSCLKALVHDDALKAHRLVRYGLSVMFDRLYTKELLLWHTNAIQLGFDFRQLPVPGYHKLFGWISLLLFLITAFALLLGLLIVALTFTDSGIFLFGLFILAIWIIYFIILWMPPTTNNGRINKGKSRWPDEVAQYNLIGYLARNRKHRLLRRLATVLVCKDYIDQLWCMKPSKSSLDITRLVHGYIAKGWKEHHMRDMATYRAFNDNRGQWTLKKEGCGSSLDWSLRRPFDESVLLWHLATDFCFHLTAVKLPSDFDEAAHRCRLMSNYMVYLLFVNPEMLMTGARRFLFREAYRQLKEILMLTPPQPDAAAGPSRQRQGEFARKIAQNVQLQHDSGRVDYMGHHFRYVYDAWRLAQHLKNLGVEQGDAKMWRVVQGVWVEMLCFSAGRCSGYLHAKSLGKGGEYLSYVWLLMNYMGMETLAEKMQRSDNGTTTASSSDIATGASANGTTVAIPVPDPGRGHGDHTTEARVPVTEGGDAGGMIPASPVQTTDGGGHGRTATSPVTLTPSGGDEIV